MGWFLEILVIWGPGMSLRTRDQQAKRAIITQSLPSFQFGIAFGINGLVLGVLRIQGILGDRCNKLHISCDLSSL